MRQLGWWHCLCPPPTVSPSQWPLRLVGTISTPCTDPCPSPMPVLPTQGVQRMASEDRRRLEPGRAPPPGGLGLCVCVWSVFTPGLLHELSRSCFLRTLGDVLHPCSLADLRSSLASGEGVRPCPAPCPGPGSASGPLSEAESEQLCRSGPGFLILSSVCPCFSLGGCGRGRPAGSMLLTMSFLASCSWGCRGLHSPVSDSPSRHPARLQIGERVACRRLDCLLYFHSCQKPVE